VTRLLVFFVMLFTVTRVAAETDRPFSQVNPLTPVSIPASTFRFTVFGDFRPAGADQPYPPQFRQTLDAMKEESPAFAVSVGDAWFGYGGTMEHYRGEVAQFLALVKGWGIPLYNVIGNHEVTASSERERYLRKQFGNLYGSFDYGNAHFICLDTDEVGDEGRIAGKQFRWLKQDLERNQRATSIFIFLHRPLFSPKDPDLAQKRSFTERVNRDTLHRLLVRYKVAAVFAGHDHLYEERVVDGIRYYITGGGGAPLYELPDKGGFYHYLSVVVRGKKTTVEVRRFLERP
jgi:UDP-2,3-diacylglucosamine pyrophosphatase LpxH